MNNTCETTDRSINHLTNELLEDLQNPTLGSLELCQLHNLTLPELAAILDSESYNQAVECIARITTARDKLLEPESKPLAKARLTDLLKTYPETDAKRETQRKAATALLSISKPNPALDTAQKRPIYSDNPTLVASRLKRDNFQTSGSSKPLSAVESRNRRPRTQEENPHMKTALTIAAIAVSASAITAANAAVIGIDNRNGFDADTLVGSGSDFALFRDAITELGHSIVLINDYTNLSGLDAIIAQNPHQSDEQFSALEIESINNFVASGRGMLALGEAGGSSSTYIPNMNQMISNYGASFGLSQLSGSGLIVSDFVGHAVTAGVSQVGIDFYRMVDVTGDTMDLTGDGSDFVAALDGVDGAGNTAFVGDVSLWKAPNTGSDYNITDFDNELFLQNIITYITVPAPSSLSLLAFAAVATRRRRS